jgi:hypothetical protein
MNKPIEELTFAQLLTKAEEVKEMSSVEIQSILFELAEYRRFRRHVVNRSEELNDDSIVTISMKATFKMFRGMFDIVKKSKV